MLLSISPGMMLGMHLCAAWIAFTFSAQMLSAYDQTPQIAQQQVTEELTRPWYSRSVVHTDREAAWGGKPPAACATADASTIVTWDSTASPPRCIPDVCGGAMLTDLRDVNGKANVGQICAGPLFDTKRTKACLKDKRVLFLGDSSMHEVVIDIVALLEGLAHNNTEFHNFIGAMNKYHVGETLPLYRLPGGTVLAQFGGTGSKGRNFTVTTPSSSEKLHFRFIGHHHLGDNCIGLPTIFHPVVMPELLCELALIPPDGLDCRPAHILVLNSGQHDKYVLKTMPVRIAMPYFTAYLDSLLALLIPHHQASQDIATNCANSSSITPIKMVWRGNTRHKDAQEVMLLEQMDNIVRERLERYDIPFLETNAVMRSTPNFPECCTVSHVHIGFKEFELYLDQKKVNMSFTASSMATNQVLRSICPFPVDA